VRKIDISATDLISSLLVLDKEVGLCVLDSCNDTHPGSQFLIAGISPVATHEITNNGPAETLTQLDEFLAGDEAAVFTISYDFGRKLENIGPARQTAEPDLFVSLFEHLIIHNYETQESFITGNLRRIETTLEIVESARTDRTKHTAIPQTISSNFTRPDYLAAVEVVKERIRRGDTYQTNLTQQLTVKLPGDFSKPLIFERLRSRHPSPFAAYLERPTSTVISSSPESFLRINRENISASPIKGTRPRGTNPAEDRRLRHKLQTSEKDRAENTMIVDLLRNDLGRVCEYGSVTVRDICSIQELATLFHLVSTIDGQLRPETRPSDIIRALFPCGSITGAPKISTMRIIDEIEPNPRGLSMGAIGIYVPESGYDLEPGIDMSVAIRTMTIRENDAVFNVGGGITIDSDPECEYKESLIKARALLDSLGVKFPDATLFREPEHLSTSVV